MLRIASFSLIVIAFIIGGSSIHAAQILPGEKCVRFLTVLAVVHTTLNKTGIGRPVHRVVRAPREAVHFWTAEGYAAAIRVHMRGGCMAMFDANAVLPEGLK